ncbi:MAG: benzodiazapine receptor [Rhodothermales bacterium]|jgi:benzodiazapine receptor
MARTLFDRATNVAAFLVVLLANYLANALPLGGRTTGQISDAYPTLFTPAGYTFAIWGVIYLLLIGFVIRQAWPSERGGGALARIDWPFRINCLANASWIVAWHYDQLVLSLVFMMVILWSLARIVGHLRNDPEVQRGWSYLLIALPFSVYFGWISVAAIANVSVLQSAWGLNDLLIGQAAWTFLKLGAAAVAAVVIGWKRADPPYAFVVTWAALGIAAARAEHPQLQVAALVVAGVAFLSGAFATWRRC